MARAQKIVTLALLALVLVGSLLVFTEYWMRFTAVFIYAAFVRAIWTAPEPGP